MHRSGSNSLILRKALSQLDEAAKILNLDEWLRKLLGQPQRTLNVFLPVRMDNSKIEVFTGYLVQHNNARGPFSGGVLYRPDILLDDMIGLSIQSTWIYSMMNIPFGGSRGAIVCNTKKLSHGEIERLSRRYAYAISDIVNPHSNIFGPSWYSGQKEMSWITDTYSILRGNCLRPEFTVGKPESIGGIDTSIRNKSRFIGLVALIREATKRLHISINKSTVGIQGFGPTGRIIAQLMEEHGAKIIAVATDGVCFIKGDGFPIDSLIEYYLKCGTLDGFPGSYVLTYEELFTLDITVLVMTGYESHITEEYAERIAARILVEASPTPSYMALNTDKILHENKTLVVPDILAKSGSVAISYIEWLQNIKRESWSLSDVFEKLDVIMTKSFNDIYDAQKSMGLT
jgi:glutamate dehydrogenase/leucine dehydrogenase